MKNHKNKKIGFFRIWRAGLCFGFAALTFNAAAAMPPVVQAYAEVTDYTDVYYEGVAEGKVNVRVAAGENSEQVMHGGAKVQLKAGDRVTIIGEDMVGTKVWYHILFERDGEEITGFCTSSYVEKTSKQVEITPTPAPTPTPTPDPTPTSDATPTPDVTPTPVPPAEPEKEEKDGVNTGIIIALVVVVVAGAGLIFLKSKKAQEAGKAASRKMAQLKKMKIAEGGEGADDGRGRRKPEVKSKANYRETQAEQVYQDVYVKRGMEEEPVAGADYAYLDQGGAEEIKANAAKENEERRALRAEIEDLREHDLVIHKYFGKGEVYDNSDVRLIEVRFGSDVRFMNKDALAAKKLMKRCSEETMRYHRRGSERPNRDDFYD
ncbi:MAG: SH3 domain-containing protein [Lachnospiraceae bacterium]|nr:SH3 domain-containing protein [Lachnospiraceae bacterium]